METSITFDHSDLTRGLTRLAAEQAPRAAAKALTDVAWDAAKALGPHMETVFDQPTRFTKNAFRAESATATKLEAKVLPKDGIGKRHYLLVQEEGGLRPFTGLEKRLRAGALYEGDIQSVVPGDDAKLNRFGNLAPSEVQRLLSGVGAQFDARQNTTAASKARKPRRETYFVPRNGGLVPGVYARRYTPASGSRGPKDVRRLVLRFFDFQTRYRPRLGFEEFVAEFYDREIEIAFLRRLEQALKRAA